MDGLAVVVFGVVAGFGGVGAVVTVLGAKDVPGATRFLASPVEALVLSGAAGLGTALIGTSGFGVTLLALVDIAGLAAAPVNVPAVVGLGTPEPMASVVGLDVGEPGVAGAGAAGLSGTEGKRCAKMSAARVGVAVAVEASCSSFFVMTSTSSRRVKVAAGFTKT